MGNTPFSFFQNPSIRETLRRVPMCWLKRYHDIRAMDDKGRSTSFPKFYAQHITHASFITGIGTLPSLTSARNVFTDLRAIECVANI